MSDGKANCFCNDFSIIPILDKLYLTNRDDHQEEVSGIDELHESDSLPLEIFDLTGRRIGQEGLLPNQLYVKGGRKWILK